MKSELLSAESQTNPFPAQKVKLMRSQVEEAEMNHIIEPHGRGVPEAILNDRSPRAGLPEWGRSPHEGRPARGERSLSMAEGTPSRVVLFLLYPPYP